MEVRVCAVIPVLNEEKFIAKCIESLLAQTMPVEILVMEGGSTDNTKQILAGIWRIDQSSRQPGKTSFKCEKSRIGAYWKGHHTLFGNHRPFMGRQRPC